MHRLPPISRLTGADRGNIYSLVYIYFDMCMYLYTLTMLYTYIYIYLDEVINLYIYKQGYKRIAEFAEDFTLDHIASACSIGVVLKRKCCIS